VRKSCQYFFLPIIQIKLTPVEPLLQLSSQHSGRHRRQYSVPCLGRNRPPCPCRNRASHSLIILDRLAPTCTEPGPNGCRNFLQPATCPCFVCWNSFLQRESDSGAAALLSHSKATPPMYGCTANDSLHRRKGGGTRTLPASSPLTKKTTSRSAPGGVRLRTAACNRPPHRACLVAASPCRLGTKRHRSTGRPQRRLSFRDS